MTEVDVVGAANEVFYRAHEGRDIEAMAAVWEHSDRIVCIHPGWPILRGWAEVGESWRRIFEGPGRNQFLLTNTSIEVASGMAWVTSEENLVDHDNVIAMAATNVFARTHGVWLLIAHHASPIMTTLG